jgi:hypothetical protein
MEKKVFAIFIFLLVLSTFFVSAANETIQDKAYSCLASKVNNNCDSLSTEEKIFSLLALGTCKSELISDSSSSKCWPSSDCKIKTTAQAILALKKVNSDTSKAETWLLDKNISFSGVDWFLQIESNNATSCTAAYSGTSYSFSINEDKTIDGNAGSCLSVYNNYWLEIAPKCYNKKIDISCSDSFMTSLLYKKSTSDTVYVSDKTDSASGEGTTTQQVESYCFSTEDSCDYEGTLWAAIVLKYLGKDVSPFVPYLVSMADENSKYLPESFLYTLTNNFRTDLLARQQESKWWAASGDKFYDTAVALLPFQNEDSLAEKTNSQNWLGEVQGTDGCWQENIRNTAFILYSLWPKITSESSTTTPDCETSNHFCMSTASCSAALGNASNSYSGCFGTNICCDKQQQLQSCSDQNGDLCASGESCLGGTTISASDSTSSKSCCIDGTCGVKSVSECEVNGGTCKSSCSSSEQLGSFTCPVSGICCIAKTTASSNVWVIVLLVILIILVALGIIFRKKLQEFYFRLKSGKGKPSSQQSPGPRFPPTSSASVYPGAVQRKIINPQTKTVTKTVTRTVARPPVKNKSEFDDVLKKLKEIGK